MHQPCIDFVTAKGIDGEGEPIVSNGGRGDKALRVSDGDGA